MDNIEKLENDIKNYATAYYCGNAIISDEEFDSLVDKLRQLNPESKVLHTPGWGYKPNGNKLKHKYQLVKSLDKCKTYDEIPERFKNKEVMLSPKLDGLTGVFYYKNGQLTHAITRGDGTEGKDITDKAVLIVGTEIKDKNFTGAVRGELEISEKNFEIIKDKYPEAKNARNLCAGWINSKEYNSEEIKLIDFVTYKINGLEEFENSSDANSDDEDVYIVPTKKSDIIYLLKNNFEHVIPDVKITIPSYGFDEFMESMFQDFKQEGYVLDGIVISATDVKYDRKSYSYIYDEVAYKFPSQETSTVIKDITWTLSRTMRMVPVLNIEAVNLAGATIENVTGNNAKYLIDNGLGVGAEITVCRSNEVIPRHMNTIQPADVNLPEVCPVCGEKLEWVGVDLKCTNSNCEGVDSLDLQRWCECVGETDGLQWTLMKQYLDLYGVSSIDSLYDKSQEILDNLNSRDLSKTEQKILLFFEKLFVRQVPIEKALTGLNIPRLGDKTAKLLGKDVQLIKDLLTISIYGRYENLRETCYERCLQIVKDATTQSIYNNLDKFVHIRYLFGLTTDDTDRIVFVSSLSDNEEIKYVAVTGALETMKRKDFESYINKYGYELTSNLKKCKYLVTNTPDSGSSKNTEAQKYNIPIITEREFLNKLLEK